MARLKNKVALITGAATGIGRCTAELFASEGAKVTVVDISVAGGEETVSRIQAAGGEAIFAHTDVTDADSVAAAVKLTVDTFGQLHILHNNAGGSTPNDGSVVDAPIEEFWRAISLDLFGTFLGCRFAVPEIIKAGGGSVINMTSNVALMGIGGRDCYTAAKGGVAAMTRSMAVEFAPDKVRVNAIAPSSTRTERSIRIMENDPDIAAITKTHLLGLIEPIEIAAAALYFASDDSRVTTGQILSVDSGVTIS